MLIILCLRSARKLSCVSSGHAGIRRERHTPTASHSSVATQSLFSNNTLSLHEWRERPESYDQTQHCRNRCRPGERRPRSLSVPWMYPRAPWELSEVSEDWERNIWTRFPIKKEATLTSMQAFQIKTRWSVPVQDDQMNTRSRCSYSGVYMARLSATKTLHLVSMGAVEHGQKERSRSSPGQLSLKLTSEVKMLSVCQLHHALIMSSYTMYHVKPLAFKYFWIISNVCACPNQEKYDLNKER